MSDECADGCSIATRYEDVFPSKEPQMTDLEKLAALLADYTPCLDVGQCICDRRVVDEVIAALRAQAREKG